MNRATIAIIGVGAVVAAGVIGWYVATGDRDDDSPAPVPTISAPDGENPAVDDVEGDGEQQPRAALDQSDLTPPGTELSVGDRVVINAYQSSASADPYLAITVTDISEPLAGDARSAAFALTDVNESEERVVQRLDVELELLAGSGNIEQWQMLQHVLPINDRMRGMPVSATGSDDCERPQTPLRLDGEAVHVCLFAFGTVDHPRSGVASVMLQGLVDGNNERLFVRAPIAAEADHDHDH